LRGRHAEPARRFEIDVGRRLAVGDLVAGDDHPKAVAEPTAAERELRQ
jgi:hypothetical protein